MSNKSNRALRAALAEPWAITAEGLELVLSVAARENDVSIEALEAYRAEHVPTAERLSKRGSVAILEVRGPLVSRANLFTAVSGATSYDILRRDLQIALDDQAISAVIMKFDTPGGAVTGVNELAKAIRDGKEKKRIVAYVEGMSASAGYWLASQSSEIIIDETAILGSIGVRAALRDTSKKDAEAGLMEFISSNAPGKRTDLSTDEGRARIQRTVDALEGVFLATVAKGRGVTVDDVIAKFGGGDVLIGSTAVAAGMADRIGTFEAVVAELQGRKPISQNGSRMPLSSPTAYDERARINAILTDPLALDRQGAAHHLAFGTELTVEQAVALLATVAPTTPTQAIQSLPATVARAHQAEGGLLAFDATLGSIARVEAGGLPIGASIGFMPAPDPFAKSDPKAKGREQWKKITDGLNAETEHAIRT